MTKLNTELLEKWYEDGEGAMLAYQVTIYDSVHPDGYLYRTTFNFKRAEELVTFFKMDNRFVSLRVLPVHFDGVFAMELPNGDG